MADREPRSGLIARLNLGPEHEARLERYRAEQEAEDAAEEVRRQREERRDRLNGSGVASVLTDQMLNAVFRDELESTRMLVHARCWLGGRRPVLVLLGTVGRGKTVAAAACLVEAGGKYLRARALAKLWASGYREDRDRCEALLSTRELVVIDDVGTEPVSEALDELIDARQSRRRRLVLISNLSMGQLRERLGERAVSRLAANAEVIADAGDDLRQGREKDEEVSAHE